MRNQFFRATLLLLVLLLAPLSALAHEDEACGLVSLFDAWARPAAEGMPNGAVFGLLVNLSGEADTLVSATTPVATAVEFHQTTMGEGDVMQMRPVEGGFAVPSNNYLQLQPGSYHIMLIGLQQPLEAGSSFELTLTFAHAGEVSVTIPVVDMDAMAADMGMGMDMATEAASHMSMATEMPASVLVASEACAGLHVVGAWARPAAAAMPNSAAYALLLNLTDTDDTLVSASTDAAEVTELHEMLMGEGDVMQMRPIEGGIPVPAGGTALLQSGGLHVMLIGLKAELHPETTLELTLTFEHAGTIEVTVPVQEPAEAPMSMGG